MNAPKYTTIKVISEARDELNRLAASEGRTAGTMLEKLVVDHQWRLEVEQAKRAMREAPQDVWEEYMREAVQWDSTLTDSIEDDPSAERNSAT